MPINTNVVSLNPAQAGVLDTLCDQVCQLLAAGWLFVSYLQQVGCLSVTCSRLVVCQLLATGWLFVSYLWQVGCLSVTCGRLVVCQFLAAGWLFVSYLWQVGCLSVTCGRLVVFSRLPGFLHQ